MTMGSSFGKGCDGDGRRRSTTIDDGFVIDVRSRGTLVTVVAGAA
jgi:hypothetical protein